MDIKEMVQKSAEITEFQRKVYIELLKATIN